MMPKFLHGILNIHSKLIVLYDLKYLLGINGSQQSTPLSDCIIIRHAHEDSGIKVDNFGDVVEFDASTLEPLPDNMKTDHKMLAKGIIKLEADTVSDWNQTSDDSTVLVVLLDCDNIIHRFELEAMK